MNKRQALIAAALATVCATAAAEGKVLRHRQGWSKRLRRRQRHALVRRPVQSRQLADRVEIRAERHLRKSWRQNHATGQVIAARRP